MLQCSPSLNPHGTGYVVSTSTVPTSCDLDLNADANHVFKIQNSSSRNSINGHPVCYKIHAPPFQKILADKESYHFRRAEFADHNIYMTARAVRRGPVHEPEPRRGRGAHVGGARG